MRGFIGLVAENLAGSLLSYPQESGAPRTISVSGSTKATASSGIYGTISVSGHAELDLSPGVYVVTKALSITGNARIEGSHVTILLACSTYPASCVGEVPADMTITGNATLSVSSGAIGPGVGVTVASPVGIASRVVVSGNAKANMTGSVALGVSNISVSGNATLSVDGGVVAAGQVAVFGNATLSVDKGPLGIPPTTYTYDGANRLTSVNSSELTASYTYDAAGLRNSATTNGTTQVFTWNVATSTPQILSDGTNDYIYGPSGMPIEQIDTATATPTYLHEDQLGSIRLLTDATGKVVGTKSFSAYGALVAQAGITTPLGFAGGYTDPTGLVYLVNRYYDPATGQFLTVDPLVNLTGSPYAYAGNDPLNMTDPLGLLCDWWNSWRAYWQCLTSGFGNLWDWVSHHLTLIAAVAGTAALFVASAGTAGPLIALALGAIATFASAGQTAEDISSGAGALKISLDILATVTGMLGGVSDAAAIAAEGAAMDATAAGNQLVAVLEAGKASTAKQVGTILDTISTAVTDIACVASAG
jgi:RHS repeat-associated protein